MAIQVWPLPSATCTYNCSVVCLQKSIFEGFYAYFLSATLNIFALKDGNCFFWCIVQLDSASFTSTLELALREELVSEGIGCWSLVFSYVFSAKSTCF